MNDLQIRVAELKLRAYQAAINACTGGHPNLNMMSGPSVVQTIKAEAERLWAWMVEEKDEK